MAAAIGSSLPFESRLRVVLVFALDRDAATVCLGASAEAGTTLYPSTLYGQLAAAALRCPETWRRCARAVEFALGKSTDRYDDQPAEALANLASGSQEFLVFAELAAILWSLLRRQPFFHDPFSGQPVSAGTPRQPTAASPAWRAS